MKTMKNSRLLAGSIICGCCGVHAAGFFISGMAWEEQGNDDGYLLTMESLSREKRRGSDCNVAEESINISD